MDNQWKISQSSSFEALQVTKGPPEAALLSGPSLNKGPAGVAAMPDTHSARDLATYLALGSAYGSFWSSLRASFAKVRSKQSISPITEHRICWQIWLAQVQGT